MKLIHCTSLVVFFFSIVCARAAEPAKAAGEWTWSFQTDNGNESTSKLKLKVDGEKITGTISGRGGMESPIEEGRIAGDELSFKTVRERNGNKMIGRYQGKVAGDTIKGTIQIEANGETRKREWEAKRAGAGADGSKTLTGLWRYPFSTPGGQSLEPELRLKQNGVKLTGTLNIFDNDMPILDGQIQGEDVSFRTQRVRDGKTNVTTYAGKFKGDTIRGKIDANFAGESRSVDWNARRVTAKDGIFTGTWRYSFTTPTGQSFEPRLRLTQHEEAVSGVILFNENEARISHGEVKNETISFDVSRERDGQTFNARYQGKLEGNMIVGTIDSDWGGVQRHYEFEARKVRGE